MNEQQRQELIEKRELGTLTAEEYRLYLDLLENDDDFADQLALHQLLMEAVHHEADQELWESIVEAPDSEQVSPQPNFWLIIVNHPWARRGVYSLLLVLAGIGGYWWYQYNNNRRVVAELPVFNVKTRQEGMGAGSENGNTPNRLLPVVLSRHPSDTLDKSRVYYSFSTDTLRLYLSPVSSETIQGWRISYDAIPDNYKLIRPGKPPLPLLLTDRQIRPLP
ncbi:hypothetical protein GO730_21355 [Spirosoma sp. HMF3257]|uniref:Uncharacterized protein n=1 Tax=Spirosoma telluris TaxID=2183553 RepID=A0A327NLK0_9BACT|nr:hypothetical protein [Spirosoma telluris]RAI76082.1 hypothetical protein HMF3257_21275 [Spirosoma telluris]